MALSATAFAGPISVTWQVQESFPDTALTRSVRGLAISPDDSELYVGFIQGTTAATTAVTAYPTATLLSSPAATLNPGGGLQPKGVATDASGNVYFTDSNASGSTSQVVKIYNASLTTQIGSFTVPSAVKDQLGGIAVATIGSKTYAYVTTNKSASTTANLIERFDVTTPGSAFLDTTWGSSGVVDLGGGNPNQGLNGIEVGPDGTLYVAAGISARADTLFKVSADGSTKSSVALNGAMDVAMYDGYLFVSQYLTGSSTIAVVDPSNLSVVETIPTIDALHTNPSTDSGYAGIAISSDGHIYLEDQQTDSGGADRIFVSSAISLAPEPASIGLLAVSGVMLLARRRKMTV